MFYSDPNKHTLQNLLLGYKKPTCDKTLSHNNVCVLKVLNNPKNRGKSLG